ncbi:ABC transporter substrate-binding protein [Bacillus sp. SCS-153A]|uniref:ABC transporter substrate-binding protein n=1 Tax=Rossellomorea sedimentorum TaxID=3115294 RepID=UPI003905EDBB
MFLHNTRDSPIQSPKDLDGKTVGYPGIPLNEALLDTMVKADDGDPEKVKTIDVGFELGSSIVNGKANAAIGAYINLEVPILKHEGYNTRYFIPVDYGVPSFYELVFVTNDATWNDKEENIRAFWRAASKGYDFIKENHDEALKVLLSNQDEANFPLVEKESLGILLPKMESEGEAFGSQSAPSWQETIVWLEVSGLIDEKPITEDIFINIVE